jgi:hypothetical protein
LDKLGKKATEWSARSTEWAKRLENLKTENAIEYKSYLDNQLDRIKEEKQLRLSGLDPEQYKNLVEEELKTISLSEDTQKNIKILKRKRSKASDEYAMSNSTGYKGTIESYKLKYLNEKINEMILKQMGMDPTTPEKYFGEPPK